MKITDWEALDHGPFATPEKFSREEFIYECATISRSTPEHVLEYHEITKCECGGPDCPGWVANYLLKNKRERRA